MGGLWQFWWIKYAVFDLRIFPLYSHWLSAPFGIDLRAYATNIDFLFALPFTAIWNNIAAYNIQILITIPLSGLAAYLLAYRLTKNFWASFFGGLIFAISPFHITMIHSFNHLAQIQWFGFYLYFLWLYHEDGKKRDFILAIAFFILIAWTAAYYAVMALIMTLILGIIRKGDKRVKGEKREFLILPIIALVVIFIIFQFLQGSSFKEFSIGDLKRGAAHLWYWFLPAENHPILGDWIKSLRPGFSFSIQTIYLGMVPLALSIYWLIKSRNNKSSLPVTGYPLLTKWLLYSSIIAIIFTVPPILEFGWLKIYTPTYPHFLTFPFMRILTRYSLIVIFSLSIFSALGINYLFKKLKTNLLKFGTYGLLLGAMVFEFLPAQVSTNLSNVPPQYQWLAEQEKGSVIAEYPFFPINDYIWEPMFWQTVHHQPLFNSFYQVLLGKTGSEFLSQSDDLKIPETIDYLRLAGVKYILVYTKGKNEIQDREISIKIDLNILDNDERLDFVKVFPEARIYQIKNYLSEVYASVNSLSVSSNIDFLKPDKVYPSGEKMVLPKNDFAVFLSENFQDKKTPSSVNHLIEVKKIEAEDQNYIIKNDGWSKIETSATSGTRVLYSPSTFENPHPEAQYKINIERTGRYEFYLNLLFDDIYGYLQYKLQSGEKTYEGKYVKPAAEGEGWRFRPVKLGDFELDKGDVVITVIHDRPEVEERFDRNITLYESIDWLALSLDQKQDQADVTRPELTFERKNMDHYNVKIKNAKNPYYLILMRSFDEKWKVKIDAMMIEEDKHFVANGFANAWLVEKMGEYEMEIYK